VTDTSELSALWKKFRTVRFQSCKHFVVC